MRAKLHLIATVAMVASGCYDPREFQGGEITDEGFFTYPRYKARLGLIPLHTEGEYTFEFSGLPTDKMWLQMYIDGRTDSDRGTLANLSTRLEAELITKDGKVVCRASGSPSGPVSNRWTLMSGGTEAAYWHSNCLGLSLSQTTEYLMTIGVSEIDAKTPEAMLVVALEGGGIELP